jgi:hypothetical protein
MERGCISSTLHIIITLVSVDLNFEGVFFRGPVWQTTEFSG